MRRTRGRRVSVRGEVASSPLRSPATRPYGGNRERHVLRAQGAPTTQPLRATSRPGIEPRATPVPYPPPRQSPMGVRARPPLIVSGEATRTSRIARPNGRRADALLEDRPRASEVLAASSPPTSG